MKPDKLIRKYIWKRKKLCKNDRRILGQQKRSKGEKTLSNHTLKSTAIKMVWDWYKNVKKFNATEKPERAVLYEGTLTMRIASQETEEVWVL